MPKAELVVALTMKEAYQLGIVRCASCGFPHNNHFDFGERVCAHSSKCTGWVPRFTVGQDLTIKPPEHVPTKARKPPAQVLPELGDD
jgi:hypothetical protein